MNAPFRPYGDGSLSQLVAQDAMAFVERAKQHLQMFGNNPNAAAAAYQESILPQLYQRHNLNNINMGLWQGFWPQHIPANFLTGISGVNGPPQMTSPPPQQKQSIVGVSSMSPPATSTTGATSVSPAAVAASMVDIREKYFKRFSPYQIPQHGSSSSTSTPSNSGSPPN